MFGRHKAARGRQYFSKYYPKQYFIKDNEHHSMYLFLEINIHFYKHSIHNSTFHGDSVADDRWMIARPSLDDRAITLQSAI